MRLWASIRPALWRRQRTHGTAMYHRGNEDANKSTLGMPGHGELQRILKVTAITVNYNKENKQK